MGEWWVETASPSGAHHSQQRATPCGLRRCREAGEEWSVRLLLPHVEPY